MSAGVVPLTLKVCTTMLSLDGGVRSVSRAGHCTTRKGISVPVEWEAGRAPEPGHEGSQTKCCYDCLHTCMALSLLLKKT